MRTAWGVAGLPYGSSQHETNQGISPYNCSREESPYGRDMLTLKASAVVSALETNRKMFNRDGCRTNPAKLS
jgi:hypothetical protein